MAVVAVLLYHAGLTWIPGGFLGVEVFFVISGYLITSLLVSEATLDGTISLTGFWARRARRLLPAAYVLLATLAVVVATFDREEAALLRGQLVAALAYASNWYLVLVDASYFASEGRPSPLQHLWSLAIEEQFYLVWPLVVLGLLRLSRGRRWPLAVVVAVGVVASALAMALLYRPGHDPSRVYFGTDTRAQGLLLGALVGVLWRPGQARRERVTTPPRALEVGGMVGLAGLVAAFVFVHDYDARLYRGGFAIIGLLTVLVIAACAHPGAWLGRSGLGWAPLGWLGMRSYGLYLWHWPIFVFTRPGLDLPWGTVPTLAVRLAATMAVAELSYRFIETPVRGGALGRWLAVAQSPDDTRRRLRRRGLKVVGGALVAVMAPVGLSIALASNNLGMERSVLTGASVMPAAAGPSELPLPAAVEADAPLAPASRSGPIASAKLANRTVTVLADSVLLGTKVSLAKELAADGWDVEYRGRPAWMVGKAATELARDERPVGSVVIVGLGYNSLWERDRANFRTWATRFDEAADGLVATLRSLGAERIVWVLVREPNPEVLPPGGKAGFNAYAWFFPYVNERLRALRVRQPDVVLVDWAAVSNRKGVTYDAIHLTSAGVRLMIDIIRSTTGL